jgi:hypothetical protein
VSDLENRLDAVGSRTVTTVNGDTYRHNSAISWAAIFAGAAGAAVLSLLLLILGVGLGLSAISPWTMEGISAATFGFATIAWLTFTQLAASGVGGYLTGRLRTNWTAVHADEVFFRDTAHGFLSWAVAALLVMGVLTSVAGTIVSGGVRAGGAVASGAANTVSSVTNSGQLSSSLEYFVDALFRPIAGAASESNVTVGKQQSEAATAAGQEREFPREALGTHTAELVRIFARALTVNALSKDDESYVAQLIAQRTGMTQQQAEQRVSSGFEEVKAAFDNIETKSREAVDASRAALAYAALWLFVALLAGAFFASLMAVCGGRQRDA